MKKQSLQGQLLKYLHSQYQQGQVGWVAKGEITRLIWKHEDGRTYLPETVGRQLRALEESKQIAVREDGISVQYKWIPHELRSRYIPTSVREGAKLFKDV